MVIGTSLRQYHCESNSCFFGVEAQVDVIEKLPCLHRLLHLLDTSRAPRSGGLQAPSQTPPQVGQYVSIPCVSSQPLICMRIVPTPFSSHAFHPVDGWLQSTPYHIFILIFPLNRVLYLVMFVLINFWTIFVSAMM